jgi:formate-dependent nitrite reductase cytochrome c552 subunit
MIFKYLYEAASKQVLLYWQQQLIDELPNEYDVDVELSGLTISLDGHELAKLQPPETEKEPWEAVKELK